MHLSLQSLSARISVVSVNFSLQNTDPNSAIFLGYFAWQVCMHSYFADLYEIECATQHYHRTLENFSIWDITVVSEHVPCQLWACEIVNEF